MSEPVVIGIDHGDKDETVIMIRGPIPMILHCPKCHTQHIDEVDEVNNPGWENPPHHKHKCLSCGNVWEPCKLDTEGVHEL